MPRFIRTLNDYRRRTERHGFPLEWRRLCPVLVDFFGEAASLDRHYFYQDLWAARKIFTRKPSHHVDVGSRVDGFIAHLLTFMPVTVVDVRPLTAQVSGLTFMQDDGARLSAFADSTIESLSSLHAVEHFGLGRFGDRVNPDAWFGAVQAFARVLKPNGYLYLSVPIGLERVEFNAHRVFSPATVLNAVPLDLVSFSAVDDQRCFHADADPGEFMNAQYACGLFEFMKPGDARA